MSTSEKREEPGHTFSLDGVDVPFAPGETILAAARRAGTPLPWLAGAAAVIVLPLFSGSFESIGRFGLLALPVFWGLAWFGRNTVADRWIRVTSVILLVAATATIPFVFP